MHTHTRKLPVSVFVVCLNEEKHIERLLKSCARMHEIILVDSGSTDTTLEIAKQYPVKIFHQNWQGYAKQKQYALEQCSQDWVLNLDADEELNDALIDQFEKIMLANEYDGVRCRREDIFIGKRRSRFTKKDNNLRFYKRDKVAFNTTDLVHETACLDGKELQIKNAFVHYGYNEVAVVVDKQNTYSTLKAREKFQNNKKFSYLKLVLAFPVNFIKLYVLKGYVFSGMRGFILANSTAYYAFLKEAKLYELHKTKDIDK